MLEEQDLSKIKEIVHGTFNDGVQQVVLPLLEDANRQLKKIVEQTNSLEARMDEFKSRLTSLELRLGRIEHRFDQLEARLNGLRNG